MMHRGYLRTLVKDLDKLANMEYRLYLLHEKYRIQSEYITHRYERKKAADPDGEETKYLATISAVLRKLSEEIDAAYEGRPYDQKGE